MSRLTLKWDKCLEKLKIYKLHLINCFKKRFVMRSSAKNLRICASRAFLRSYEITDFKPGERKGTVIHRTNLYCEKVDLLITITITIYQNCSYAKK